MRLTDRERKEVLFLLSREIEEMREGWQLGSVVQLGVLEELKKKIEEAV